MKVLTVGQRLAGLIGLAVLVAVMLVGLGVYGLSASKDSLKTVFEDRMKPVVDLGQISKIMIDNRRAVRAALSDVKIDTSGKVAVLAMSPKPDIRETQKSGNILWRSITNRKFSV